MQVRGTENWPLYVPRELPKPLFLCGGRWLRKEPGALHSSARQDDDDDGVRHCIPTTAALGCASRVSEDV